MVLVVSRADMVAMEVLVIVKLLRGFGSECVESDGRWNDVADV